MRDGGGSCVVLSVPSVTIAGMATATDEDRWVVPGRWWGAALPIRGLGPAPRERVSAEAAARAARTYDAATEFVASALDNPDSDPDLVAHGCAALAGASDVLGHAVIATLVCATTDFPATGDVLDLWVTRFGVAGAAQLVASMIQLGVAQSTPSDGRPVYEGPPAIGAVAPDMIQGPVVTPRCRGGQLEGFRPWEPHLRLRPRSGPASPAVTTPAASKIGSDAPNRQGYPSPSGDTARR